jgi:hypothetical protein
VWTTSSILVRIIARVSAAEDGKGTDDRHPAWCSPDECHLSLGTRVHRQAPVRWENETAALAVESRLLDPADDQHVYVELSLRNLRINDQFHVYLPLEAARRLRDQLTAHLDAAQ